MTRTRKALIVTACLAVSYGLPALFLIGAKDFGISIAIAVACWVGYDILGKVESKRRSAYRRHRAQVWARRESRL